MGISSENIFFLKTNQPDGSVADPTKNMYMLKYAYFGRTLLNVELVVFII